MSAAPQRGSTATPLPVQLRTDTFDELVEERWGDVSETELARLIGVDRTTLYRACEGKVTPTLETAMRMAEALGTTVEELFEVTP